MFNEPTLEKLHAMRLGAMAESWTTQQRQPDVAGMSFDERFGLLVDAEYLNRENRKTWRRLREAKLRLSNASLEDIDAPARRGLDKGLIRQLGRYQRRASRLHGGQRVGHGHPEIVVTVCAPTSVPPARRAGDQIREQLVLG